MGYSKNDRIHDENIFFCVLIAYFLFYYHPLHHPVMETLACFYNKFFNHVYIPSVKYMNNII